MRVLEIGAGYAPLVPRSDGWNVFVVDHATRAELVEKYADPVHGVDVSRIEEVDVVWTAGTLADAIPSRYHGFDACIASHVIEHMPDVVGFLRSLETVLADEGFVSLAVPDMRYCFDLLRVPSRVGAMVAAHRGGATRHSLATLYDNAAYAVRRGSSIAWARSTKGELELVQTFEDGAAARAHADVGSASDGPYVDAHAWQFTPSSFELAVLELGALGLVDLRITSSHPTVGCEFFVELRRGTDVPSDRAELDALRLRLLERSAVELAETWATLSAESA